MAELFRDDLGVPHVRASDILSLARAQGDVTARDRGWQIEVDRLRAEGRLSSLIGEAGLAWDVFARRARLDDTASRAFTGLDPEASAFVRAYTDGVRRGMREVGCRAAEFRQLDEHFGDRVPLDDWPDRAPLGVLHVAHALFSSFPAMLWRERVRLALGEDWVSAFGAAEEGAAEEEGAGPSSGSNAWALHGSLTASGLPIIAGDPHRVFELPGVYQQVRLACDEFDVVGLAFPGVPGIAHFGHTGSAAWGVTNAMAHSVDVFRERLRREGDHLQALGPDGWRRVDVRRSSVLVRGGRAVEVEAIETERGPVVTDLRETSGGELLGWSVRMPAHADGNLGIGALLPLLRARSATDVLAAFGRWCDPVNRVLAADARGAVLSATVGRAPDRNRRERRLPHDGASEAPVPGRRMPPARVVVGTAVDANERPADSAVDFGWRYASPHRAGRIRELLDEHRPSTTDDLEPIWADTLVAVSELRSLLPEGDLPPASTLLRDALRDWDARMDRDSPTAALFAAWREALVERLCGHAALAPLAGLHGFGAIFDPWMSVEAQVAAVIPRLLAHPAIAPDAEGIVRAALAAAADAPPERWGDGHRLLPVHVLADVPGVTAPGADLAVPLSGDGDAVRCTGSTPGVTRRSWRGSVARWAWDLADREQSRWSVPFGASGDPASAHFADQLDGWAEVHPARVVTDWDRLTRDISWNWGEDRARGDRLATGRPGELCFTEIDPALGRIDITVLDPEADAGIVHAWVTQPRARFWGLGHLGRDELSELYAYVDSLPSHHAFLIRRDGTPVALLQTYEPENDPVGQSYRVEPGDVGVHFLLGARGAPVSGFTTRLTAVITRFMFAQPGADRIIVEPDVQNEAALTRMARLGFEQGPEIDVDGKRARLAFLSRSAWARGR
ncbi:MAG TPA: GNAT family N-acetyltransferase [Microbacterium sp.]|uniref:GNAT family N-acetyltransferase n=1 Tax=Microbacterium sp. TaxID=51671 RepID=UPI002BFC346F|nr:GNAT family N-acetyltransferase [Microbacterium sp.]HWI32486.1 GNAT family N-acetyltransferase [Microbacterium sp.]